MNPISENQIQEAIQDSKPLIFQHAFMGRKENDEILEVAAQLLQNLQRSFMLDSITYFLREFVSNANKSNIKRVYFQSKKLDIHDPKDYETGMIDFGEEFRSNLLEYVNKIEEIDLYTQVIFLVKNGLFVMVVKNSGLPTSQELDRIYSRITKSKGVRDAAEAYLNMDIEGEGAGLGLMSVMLMLRSMGVSEKAYQFSLDNEKKETVVKLILPLQIITEEQGQEISEVILKELDKIPIFPENISRLQQMMSDENVDFSKVAKVIQTDPALTAELLRMVNSAQFMLKSKVSNITNAISLLGMKTLKNLLFSYGTQQVFNAEYGDLAKIWEHSSRTASYASQLAVKSKNSDKTDVAYVAGMLHDIGKIIMKKTHPTLEPIIQAYSLSTGINGSLIENLAMGISHAKIGGNICRGWNFPPELIEPIEFHHYPKLASEETLDLVEIVYIANLLANSQETWFSPESIDFAITSKWGIDSFEEFKNLFEQFEKKYQEEKKQLE